MEAKCTHCGANLYSESKYCHRCGASQTAPKAFPSSGITLSENLASALCYLFGAFSGVLFLVLEPYRREERIRFHAWQSILFTLAWMALSAVHGLIPGGFLFFGFLAPFVTLGLFVLWVILIVKAYNGEKFVLPLLGDLAETQAKKTNYP